MLLVKTGLLFCHPNFLSLQSSMEKAMLWQNGSRIGELFTFGLVFAFEFSIAYFTDGALISLLKRKRKEKKKQKIRRNESKEGNLSIQSDPI